jgi:hypothetical protein
MTPEQFCYWLQGRAEMQPNNPPSAEEWKMVREHLQLVFRKETSARQTYIPHPWADVSRQNPLQTSTLQQSIGGMDARDYGMPQC